MHILSDTNNYHSLSLLKADCRNILRNRAYLLRQMPVFRCIVISQKCFVCFSLPPASEGLEKVIFSVCPHLGEGGCTASCRLEAGGTPFIDQDGGLPHSQVRMGGGGVPHSQVQTRGIPPSQVWAGGTLGYPPIQVRSQVRTPYPLLDGVPPSRLDGLPPRPPIAGLDGVPPLSRTGWGTPPPPTVRGQSIIA